MVALIGLARPELGSAVPAEHQLRRGVDDRGTDAGPQLRGVADRAVGKIPELQIIDADHGRRTTLLGLPQRPGVLRRHPGDPRFTATGQRVTDLTAGGGPFGDRGGHPVFGVVGVGHQHQGTAPIVGKGLRRGHTVRHSPR